MQTWSFLCKKYLPIVGKKHKKHASKNEWGKQEEQDERSKSIYDRFPKRFVHGKREEIEGQLNLIIGFIKINLS
jgi:hypothetical protein